MRYCVPRPTDVGRGCHMRAKRAHLAIVAAFLAALGAYTLLYHVTLPGVRASSNGATVPGGMLADPHTTRSSAAHARSLTLHGMPQPPERMIVVARSNQNTTWLQLRFGDIPVAIYQAVANLSEHRERCPPGQRQDWAADCCTYAFHDVGREAGAYLQFIVDFWDALPSVMLFLHAHEESWHRDAQLLNKLRWDRLGFANLRHWGYTKWACDPVAKPCHMLGLALLPVGFRESLHNAGKTYFRQRWGSLPEGVNEPACCAEFLVTAERVRLRPLSFYTNALHFAQTPKGTSMSGDIAVAFEQLWHAVFGEPYVTHATSKCDMYYCSDEEMADAALVSPPVTNPYRMPHVIAAESSQQLETATN